MISCEDWKTSKGLYMRRGWRLIKREWCSNKNRERSKISADHGKRKDTVMKRIYGMGLRNGNELDSVR